MNFPRIAQPAVIGARGFDTTTTIGPAQASRLKSAGYDFAVRYIGSLTSVEVDALLEAGICVMPVTYADKFDGAAAVVDLRKIEIPPNTTVWLDLEGITDMTAEQVSAKVNAWAGVVQAAGFNPGLYVGAECVLDGPALYRTAVTRYWRSCSLVPKPGCGWSMLQLYPPNRIVAGVQIDIDVIESDYRGRVPNWVCKQ